MKHELKKELSREEVELLINSWILNEVHRNIMRRRLCDHVKFEKLAEEFDLSTRGVMRIVYKDLDILSRHI